MRHQEGIELVVASVCILHVDVVVDSILITDGRQCPLCLNGMSVGIQDVAGEGAGIRKMHCVATVDFVPAKHQVLSNCVIIKESRFNRIRSQIVGERAVGVVIKRGLHSDSGTDKFAVGEADGQVVEIPTCTVLRSGSRR